MLSRGHVSRLVLLLAASCSSASPPPPASRSPREEPAAESPFVLSLAINHDGTQTVLRGWPLVIRISATLDREPDRAYPVGDASLHLQVRDAQGGLETWPLEAPAPAADSVLDADHASVETVRVLSASATGALAAGPRTMELAWGSARETFPVTVADPPDDSAELRQERALLEADASLARGETTAALATLDAQLALAPDSVVLLHQRALVKERAGDIMGAFVDAQQALAGFEAQVPDPEEPPVALLSTASRLRDQVIGRGE
jgi:hypothetical protein